MVQNDINRLFRQLVTVLVALAGSVSLLISGSHFSLWTTIVGVTLLLALYTYGRSASSSRTENLTFSAIFSLCAILAIGWALSLLIELFFYNLTLLHFIVGGMLIAPFGINTLVFIIWLVIFVLVGKNGFRKKDYPN
jgi:hypothetical protein